MKCPKCSYLGFETGDRCKNCGYDFSLLSEPAVLARQADPSAIAFAVSETLAEAADLPLRAPERATIGESRAVARAGAPSLPLFHPAADHDDEPLIKLPAAPRPPLAVRRTPDKPRPRQAPRPARRPVPPALLAPEPAEPTLQMLDEALQLVGDTGSVAPAAATRPTVETSGAARRFIAATIDHGMLLAVDATVIYFTLKMAGLDPGEWRLLPPLPLAAFLGMVKVAYFCAFTLVGGQTIGKMAVRIRVVGDDGAELDPARAIGRTLAGACSLLAAGLGFLPVLLADDRRGVHDRVARTRVIALPSGRHTV
jgi:uncharacterized RDD family membrane protein YckC